MRVEQDWGLDPFVGGGGSNVGYGLGEGVMGITADEGYLDVSTDVVGP